MKITYVIFDKRETMLQSMATDFVTFAFLMLCIWFSWHMGGGVWTLITVSLFLIWTCAKFPWEGAQRKTVLLSKEEAIEWANNLPEEA